MSDSVVRSCSPQRPDDCVAEVAEMSADGVTKAASRARDAQRAWWQLGAPGRAAALSAVAEDLKARRQSFVDLVVKEVGKPRTEAAGEVSRAVAILEFYSQMAYRPLGTTFPPSLKSGTLYTERRPHGVAGLITPWNFPVAIPLWKAAPALAAGNAVLLKPSPEALGCAQMLASLFEAHLPDGAFTVVPGGPTTGEALVAEADVVSFTGSASVGRTVAGAAASRGLPVQCEMGGQNAAIVLPDVDVSRTAGLVAGAAMGYAGQKCTATRRVIVIGEQPQFVEALVDAVAALRPADPDGDTAVGPVITSPARDKVVHAANAVGSAGGRVLTGGDVPDMPGWYVNPVLADRLPAGHELTCEETFGPFAVIQHVPGLDEAIDLANDVRFGLVTSVHGRDVDALLSASARLETGMIKLNTPSTGVDFYAPFGGQKDSSYGPREQGPDALDFYSSVRTVTMAAHGA